MDLDEGTDAVPRAHRPRTGRGPKVRYWRDGEAEPVVVVFPDDVDPFEVLERCFKKHGMTCSPESAARCDEVLRARRDEPSLAEYQAMKQKQRKTRWKK